MGLTCLIHAPEARQDIEMGGVLENLLKQAVQCGAGGRLTAAVDLFGQVIAADPTHLSALLGMALAQGQKGELNAALRSVGDAADFHRDNFFAHYNGGKVLTELKCYDEAVTCYDRAIALRPDHADACHDRAALLRHLRRYREALDSCGRAIALCPGYADAHNTRGGVLWDLARYEEALICCDRAIALDPDLAPTFANRGNVLHHLGRYAEAEISCKRAIALLPGDAPAHSNLGIVLADLERYEEATSSCERAILLRRDHAKSHGNRAGALRYLGRYQEALKSCERAVAFEPGLVEAHNNRGTLLQDLGRYRESLVSYDCAVTLKADYAEAYNNKGLSLLLMGKFWDGWPLQEWRWKTARFKGRQRPFSQPLWLGDFPIAGKTILLHAEQGLGDTLQFVRYAPQVAALGARVIVEAPSALIPLLRTLQGDFRWVAHGEALPDVDAHCPLMSLPLAFRTTLETIPADVPYLSADAALQRAWRERLGEQRRPRIGLAWSGNPANRNDHNRSLPLNLLLRHLSPAFDYHIVQKDLRPADEQVLRDHPQLHRHHDKLIDFAETAALLAAMDLIVSVDTSIAHLAGALGRPVWILLPYSPDWRWLTARSDSPWYPTARLFRQRRPGDWSDVLQEVRGGLG